MTAGKSPAMPTGATEPHGARRVSTSDGVSTVRQSRGVEQRGQRGAHVSYVEIALGENPLSPRPACSRSSANIERRSQRLITWPGSTKVAMRSTC